MIDEVYEGFNLYDENYNEAILLYDRIENEEVIFDLNYDEDKLQTRLIDNTKFQLSHIYLRMRWKPYSKRRNMPKLHYMRYL